MNKSIKLGFKLLLITSVTALALAFTNNMTQPIIEARRQEELKESLAVVYEADSYEELDVEKPDTIEVVYKAGDGYVFQV